MLSSMPSVQPYPSLVQKTWQNAEDTTLSSHENTSAIHDAFTHLAFLNATTNSSLRIKGLISDFLTPVSVFCPLTKYHRSQGPSQINNEACKRNVQLTCGHETRQLSMSTTWRSLKVVDAELLHAMQESLKRGLEYMLKDRLIEFYCEGHRKGYSEKADLHHRVSFQLAYLIGFILEDVSFLYFFERVDSMEARNLLRLFLRSCDCIERTWDLEDGAIDFILRTLPEMNVQEAQLITKLDFLTFTVSPLMLHEGDRVHITPKYNRGATYSPLKGTTEFELCPPVEWLSWTGSGWAGFVPKGSADLKQLEIRVRGTLTESIGRVALQRVVRSMIALNIVRVLEVPLYSPSQSPPEPVRLNLIEDGNAMDIQYFRASASTRSPPLPSPPSPTESCLLYSPIPSFDFGMEQWDLEWFGGVERRTRRQSMDSDMTFGLDSDYTSFSEPN